MDSDTLEKKIEEFFRSRAPEVVAVYLFGSAARGTARSDSDVDVGILLSEDPPSTLDGLRLDLAGALEHELATPVDLVVLNKAPPDLVHRVLRAEKLLVDREPAVRIRFEVRSRNEYFDVLPYLREYRRSRGTPE